MIVRVLGRVNLHITARRFASNVPMENARVEITDQMAGLWKRQDRAKSRRDTSAQRRLFSPSYLVRHLHQS